MSVSIRPGPLPLVALAASALLVVLLLIVPTAPTAESGPALRVQLDAETGDIVPVTDLSKRELVQQMKHMLNRSAVGLQEVRQADGGVAMNLQGRFQSLSVATTDANGRVRTGCVTSARELDGFLNGAGGAPTTHSEQE